MSTELDIQIAEKVLHWKRFEGDQIPEGLTNRYLLREGAHRQRIWATQTATGTWVKEACEECGDIPRFSSDIADCFRMWVEIRWLHPGWTLTIMCSPAGCVAGLVAADKGMGTGIAPTIPHAMALAALQASL